MFNSNNDTTESPKVFFQPGQIVILKHKEIGNRVPMYIVEKVNKQFKTIDNGFNNMFLGFRCRWFSKDYVLQEAIFSTKDLELYKK